jgi:outer membrane lipoprotein-sorting protein
VASVSRRAALATALAATLGLAACAGDPVLHRTPQDQADIGRIETYLNGLTVLQARFLQIWPDGSQSAGTAWFQAPGHFRMAFTPPDRMVLVASGGHLVLHNYTNDAVTRMATSSTPLGLLLDTPRISLDGDITVTSLQRSPGALQISLARTANPAQGLLTLTFNTAPMLLTGIEMVDGGGHDTRIRLYDQTVPAELPPALFDPAGA